MDTIIPNCLNISFEWVRRQVYVVVLNWSILLQEPTAKRHLMRLWLAPENDWELPEAFGSRWGGVKVGDRGGIYIPNTIPRAPLDAEMWQVAEEKSKA